MPDWMPTEGGAGLFRCFRAVPAADGLGVELTPLTSLGGGFSWGPGPLRAECRRGHYAEPLDAPEDTSLRPDRIPVAGCACGFYGFKNFREMVYQEGADDSLVHSLVEMWGKAIEHETGIRSEFAEIVAFIEPIRPKHLRHFPREGLQESYPSVPVVKLRELPGIIEERDLTMLRRMSAPPVLQWLTAEGTLIWGREFEVREEEQAARLPIAASHPDEVYTFAAHQLKKERYGDGSGAVYVFWQLEDGPISRSKNFEEFYRMLQKRGAHELDIHREL